MGADWGQLHNGHDYFRLLHIEIQRKKRIKAQPKGGEIVRRYKDLYPAQEFRATKLALSLKRYFAPLKLFS